MRRSDGSTYRPLQTPGAPSEPVVAPAPPSDGNGLGDIAGLDAIDGLKRVAGNAKLYRKLLLESRNEFRTACDRMRSLIAGGEVADATRLAHTVKGVAGNLGAGHVESTAGALERALKNDSTGRLEQLIDALGKAVAELLPGLDALDAPAPSASAAPAIDVDPAVVEPVLLELMRRLRADDMSAEASLDRLEELLGGASSPELARIRECVDDLEFANAVEPLERLAATLGLSPPAC